MTEEMKAALSAPSGTDAAPIANLIAARCEQFWHRHDESLPSGLETLGMLEAVYRDALAGRDFEVPAPFLELPALAALRELHELGKAEGWLTLADLAAVE